MRLKLFFTITLFTILIACENEGHGGISRSVKESKDHSLFLSEYKIIPTNIIEIDTIASFTVKDIWLERKWKYGENGGRVIHPSDGNQLCFEINERVPLEFGIDYTVGLYSDLYIRQSSYFSLLSDIVGEPDTLTYFIQEGDHLNPRPDSTIKIIGKLKLIKIGR